MELDDEKSKDSLLIQRLIELLEKVLEEEDVQ